MNVFLEHVESHEIIFLTDLDLPTFSEVGVENFTEMPFGPCEDPIG